MDGFTLIDGVVAAVIILSSLLAFSRGLVRELLAIAGWVVAAILAFQFVDVARPLVRQIPVLGDLLGSNCELSVIAAFGAVFLLALVVVSIFAPLFSTLVQRSVLGGTDQALGFIFGVARGVLLVAIAFFIYNSIVTTSDITMVDQSRSAAVFGKFTDSVGEQDPEAALGWIQGHFTSLIAKCDI